MCRRDVLSGTVGRENVMNKTGTQTKYSIFAIVVKLCLLVCALFTIVVFVYGQFFVKNLSLYANKSEIYDAVWHYTDPNGVTTRYKAFDVIDVKGVSEVRLTMTLPEKFQEGNCLFILTGLDMDAYIDGELRNSYRVSRSVFGRNVKGIWLPITLRSSDSGKLLTIVRPGNWLDEYTLNETYIGNRLGFAMQLIHDNIFILFFGFALVILGMVTTIICTAYVLITKRIFPLWYLCTGVLCGAFWIILDNFTYPLIFNNYFVDGITEFLLIMLLPYPFAAYINSLLERRYQKYYYLSCFLIIVNFVTLSILQFSDTLDFIDTMLVNNIVMLIVALYCLIAIIYDTFIAGHRKNIVITIGFCIFIILCVAEIIHVNLPVHHNDGILIAVGLLSFLILAITYEILRISELRAETLEAQKANQAKTTFLANMSHEIRTPINAILGMDELILREDTDPKVKEYARGIKSAGTALLEIISDVLDFSKIEQGKMEIVNAEYDSRHLINSIIPMIAVRTDEKGLYFEKDISADLPSGFTGDEARIREVMLNLLSNAVKYTNSGSVTLSVKHEPIDEDQAYLYISVRDTGEGIPSEKIANIWDRYYKIDRTHTRSAVGSGLGLSIVREILQKHNALFGVESGKTKGTVFWFELDVLSSHPSSRGN